MQWSTHFLNICCCIGDFSLQPEDKTCQENGFTEFTCVLNYHDDYVDNIDWYSNDSKINETLQSNNGKKLLLPCNAQNNNTRIHCTVYLPGGTVESTRAILTISNVPQGEITHT